jgi:hypothetical protein
MSLDLHRSQKPLLVFRLQAQIVRESALYGCGKKAKCHVSPAVVCDHRSHQCLQDACFQFNCGANPKRSPAPQLNQGEASADLCCVVPPIQRPEVQLLVPATTCNATENAQLALETWRQLTQGMTAADAALIVVEVGSCTAARRRLQAATLKLVITVTNAAVTATEIQRAAAVLIEAVGGPNVEALPANATLSDLIATLNSLVSNVPGNTVDELLKAVNTAIVTAGLGNVFNNATATPTGICCCCFDLQHIVPSPMRVTL